MGDADSALQKSIEVLKENVTKQNNELVQHMVEQNQRLVKVLDEQQSTLENRSQEMSRLVAEMTQLVEVKKTMQNVEKAMTDQNRKIDNLVRSISELAQIKTNGTLQVQKSTIINRLPKWLTILIVSLFAISFIWFNIWTVLFLSHA
jgi:methyl-accepting chemotaxis protein